MLKAENLKKTFGSDEKAVHAVRGASFTLRPGETAAIVGPSGSGKSTFLNMLALILPPDEGKVYLDGEEVSAGSDGMRCRVRGRCFGMIRQDFALIDDESVYANIRLPLVYNKSVKRSEQRRRIIEARILPLYLWTSICLKPVWFQSAATPTILPFFHAIWKSSMWKSCI